MDAHIKTLRPFGARILRPLHPGFASRTRGYRFDVLRDFSSDDSKFKLQSQIPNPKSQVPSFRRFELFLEKLPLVKIGVFAAESDQFVVRPAFDDASVFKDADQIGVADRRDTV